jgi:hypothetical protein
MDVNSARIIITQMEACFKELNVAFVNESEMHNCEGFSNSIKFRSWLGRNDNLAEILAFVFPSHDIVQLTMNYYENIKVFNEATIHNLFNLLNAVNNSDPAFYWLFCPEASKLEFRTAYYLAESRLSKKQFKSLLEKFLKQGPRYYSYFRRLIGHNEDPNILFYEIQVELEAL